MNSTRSRLTLKPFKTDMVKPYYVDWLNDKEVNRFLETRHTQQTLTSCTEFVKNCEQDPNSHLFAIFITDNDTHIGNVKIGNINPRYLNGQISLFLGNKTYWHKGYGTETVQLISQYAFQQLALHRLEAWCYQQNTASLRIFQANQYKIEGINKESIIVNNHYSDLYHLALLQHEFTT